MALLKGKTAVITGGTTGIGLATAKRFVEEGAYVFISGRRQAELDAAVEELGDNVTGVQGDVGKAEDLDRLYAAVADSGRRLDVVFANAAIIDVARIGDITEDPVFRRPINSIAQLYDLQASPEHRAVMTCEDGDVFGTSFRIARPPDMSPYSVQ